MQEPSLDHWTFVFLFAGAHGLFLATVLFFQKKGNLQANRVLAGIMLLFGITIFYYVAFWTGYVELLPLPFRIVLIFPLLFGPLFLFYFNLLHRKRWSRNEAWHFLPFLLFFLSNIPRYLGWQSAGGDWLYGTTAYYGRLILFNGQTLAYAIFLLWYLKKQYQQSSWPLFQYRWMQTAAFCYAGFAVSLAMYYVLYLTIDFNLAHDYAVSLFMVVFVYIAGYVGYHQPEALIGVPVEERVASKYAKSGLTMTEAAFHLKNITRYMKEKNPYLDCELTLDKLAQQVNLSRHTFSQIINENLQQNFADFINHYRIEEAQRLLSDPEKQHEKILSIAYDAGFRNKASFYNAFNKHVGQSPTQYRKQALARSDQKRKMA